MLDWGSFMLGGLFLSGCFCREHCRDAFGNVQHGLERSFWSPLCSLYDHHLY